MFVTLYIDIAFILYGRIISLLSIYRIHWTLTIIFRMSDVNPNRRVLESWLKKDNTPIFSRDIIRDAQTRAQKQSDFIKSARCTRSLMKQASPPASVSAPAVKYTPSLNGLELWNSSKSVEEIPPADVDTQAVDTNDVMSFDLFKDDVTLEPLQIPRVFRVGQPILQIRAHELDILIEYIRSYIEAVNRDPHARSESVIIMLVNRLTRTHYTAACLERAVLAEKEEAKTTQRAMQERITQLKRSLKDERRAEILGRMQLRTQLAKRFQTSETQTEEEIPVLIPTRSQGVQTSATSSINLSPTVSREIFYDSSEEIFYDALSTSDSPEEIFYDALTTSDNLEEIFYDAISTSESSEEIFYDALSTIHSPEEIFYDALSTLSDKQEIAEDEKPSTSWVPSKVPDSFDHLIMLINSAFDDTGKATPKSKGKAADGTIVKSMDDLVPWHEPSRDIRLGSGASGTVYLHRHARTNEPVALKVIDIPPKVGDSYRKRKDVIDKLQNEMRILRKLGCMEWFPEFYGCCRMGQDTIGIAMEFCGDVEQGESYSIINCMDGKGPKLDKNAWLNIILDVADGLTVMHKKGFLCNDVKEDNVLLVKSEGEWRAKIIDFGWSSDINKPFVMPFSSGQRNAYKQRQFCNYIAPECALRGKSFSASTDIYSLGRLTAFLGQEMGLKELGEYGYSIWKCHPKRRPSLRKFSEKITSMKCVSAESNTADKSSV